MSIYCSVCNALKSKEKNKTCGKPSCRTAVGWSSERIEKHSKTFNPILGGSGKRKGVKNKNPYPKSEAVLRRNKLCSNKLKEKYRNMTDAERKSYYGTNFGSSIDTQIRCRAIATENVLKQGTSKKGKYTPKNPKKYMGDPTNIIYRSMWEKKVMEFLDENHNILRWASEEIVIPYISPTDNKTHRYFPDFYMEAVTTDGSIKTTIIEVKPYAQTLAPKIPKRKTQRFLTEVMTYGVNQAKWDAAQKYCQKKGWEFKILTEKELFQKNK